MPRALVVFAHPCEESFSASLHQTVIDGLKAKGWEVDDCDLYAEGFNPVLSATERRGYHDLTTNTAPVQGYVDRLRAAEALVLVYPVWNYGFPAILKGYWDRVFLPGVSFKMVDGKVAPALGNIKLVLTVTTYGGTRWRTFLMGDPPRRIIARTLRGLTWPAPVHYLALYDMNRATQQKRALFQARVAAQIERL
jgi:NAD(P)H dehydrogenase (quinone)